MLRRSSTPSALTELHASPTGAGVGAHALFNCIDLTQSFNARCRHSIGVSESKSMVHYNSPYLHVTWGRMQARRRYTLQFGMSRRTYGCSQAGRQQRDNLWSQHGHCQRMLGRHDCPLAEGPICQLCHRLPHTEACTRQRAWLLSLFYCCSWSSCRG